MDVLRRQFIFSTFVATAGTLLSGNLNDYVSSRQASYTSFSPVERRVHKYNTQKAQAVLINYGPAEVEKQGLQNYLIGSPLEKVLVASEVLAASSVAAYGLAKSGYASKMYEAFLKALKDVPLTNNRYGAAGELALIIGASEILANCSNNSIAPEPNLQPTCTPPQVPQNGTCITPSPTAGNIALNVATMYNKSPSGLVDAVYDNGSVASTQPMQDGVVEFKNIPNPEKITRLRFRENGSLSNRFLNSDLKVKNRFAQGNNQDNYMLVDRLMYNGVESVSDFFGGQVNWNCPLYAVKGLKKAVGGSINKVIIDPTDAGFYNGRQYQTVDERIAITRDKINEVLLKILGIDSIPIEVSKDLPKAGNGNVTFRYTNEFNTGIPHFNGSIVDGGDVYSTTITQAPSTGKADGAELGNFPFAQGIDNRITPSIANEPSTGFLTKVDLEALIPSYHLLPPGTNRSGTMEVVEPN